MNKIKEKISISEPSKYFEVDEPLYNAIKKAFSNLYKYDTYLIDNEPLQSAFVINN